MHIKRASLFAGITFIAFALITYYKTYARDQPTVVVQNFVDYIPPSVIQSFEKDTGIKVIYTITPDQDGSIIDFQLTRGIAQYDIMILSLFPQADRLRNMGYIQELDTPNPIPYSVNLSRISQKGKVFCIPYVMGVTAIIYNKQRVIEALGGIPDNPFDLVYDIETVRNLYKHGVRISIADAPLEIIPSLLYYWGRDLRKTILETDLIEAITHLGELKAYYRRISLLLYVQDIQNNRADIVLGWSTFLKQCIKDRPYFEYHEQPMVWMDVICINAGSKNKENAIKFLEHIAKNIDKIGDEYNGHTLYSEQMIFANEFFDHSMVYKTQTLWCRMKMNKTVYGEKCIKHLHCK